MSNESSGEVLIFYGRPSGLLMVGNLIWNGLVAVAVSVVYVFYIKVIFRLLLKALPPQIPELYISWGLQGLIWFILGIAVLSIVVAALRIVSTRYRITSQRLQQEWGIFSRHMDNLELSRVTDIAMSQPFVLRLAGQGNILLTSSDRSTPHKLLRGLPEVRKIMESMSNAVRPGVVHEFRS